MEPKFKTSFIPKKSLEADVSGATPGRYVNRRSISGPGFYLTFFIFLMTLAASVGVFGYTEVVIKQLEEKRDRLVDIRAAFRPEQIAELTREDLRLENAKTLLGEHVAVTELFDLLEEITLKKVRYTDFSFQNLSTTARGGAAATKVTLTGEGASLQHVALQIDQFDTNTYLNNPAVTRLTRVEKEEEEEITEFSITVDINPQLVSYATALTDKRRGASTPATPKATETQSEPALNAGPTATSTPANQE